jgi:hypothetical protein
MSEGLSHLFILLTRRMARTTQKAIIRKPIGIGFISTPKKGKLKRLSSLKISAVVNPRTNKFANMETTIPKSATNPICRSKIFIKVFPILH